MSWTRQGYLVVYKPCGKRISLWPSAMLEDPKHNVGVIFSLPNRRGPYTNHLVAERDGKPMSWGYQPIPKAPTIVKATKFNEQYEQNGRTYRCWWQYKGAFTFPQVGCNYPIRDKGECVKCGQPSFWRAFSYASGLMNYRRFDFCVDCTLAQGEPIKPSKRMVCRICRENEPDIMLHRDDEETYTGVYSRRGLKHYVFQVPIHNACRSKLFQIPPKPTTQWWDVPPTLKIEV